MKIGIITDTHFGARNNSFQMHENFLKFFKEQFFPWLKENEITDVIHAGDIMDNRKNINISILHSVESEILSFFEENEITLHVLLGNHDIYYRNTSHINSVTHLAKGKKFFKVYSETQDVSIKGEQILFIPWITPENSERSFKAVAESTSNIAIGHLEMNGFEYSKGRFAEHGVDPDVFKKFDLVMSGHYHHKSENKNIMYLGSPYPMNWGDYGDFRGFHLLELDGKEFNVNFIQNPLSIFQKVYYNDSNEIENGTEKEFIDSLDFSHVKDTYVQLVVEAKNDPYLYELFITKLSEYSPIDIKVHDVYLLENSVSHQIGEDEIKDLSVDTISLLETYIEGLPEYVDKPSVKNKMRELYSEAIEMASED